MTDTPSTAIAPRTPGKPPRPERIRITRKVRRAIHDMVWEGDTIATAAAKHGIQPAAFSRALSRPSVQSLIKGEVDVLRASTRPRALRVITNLMNDSALDRVKLDAAKYIDSGDKQGGVVVNVGVGVNVQTPGYVVDVSGHTSEVEQILRQARNERKPLELQADVPTDA